MARLGLVAQKGRALAYAGGLLIALVSVWLGLIEASWLEMGLLIAVAYVSIGIFVVLYRTASLLRWVSFLSLASMLLDSGLITWTIHITGGADSLWAPCYLANISGAAFLLGEGGALTIALVDTFAYLTLLIATGQIDGFGPELMNHVFVMLVLIGSSLFLLYGVTVLRRRKEIIQSMQRSERRQIEELKRLAAELDTKTRDLKSVNVELREASRLKSQFLANMSHELRTPLNSIIGFSEILQRRLSEQLEGKYQRFLTNIHSSGMQLLEMINDILDLAKIEVGRIELKPAELDAGKVIQGVIRIIKGGGEHPNVNIVTELEADNVRFEADPARIKQVLYHLLSNAIKFSSEASTVKIKVQRLTADLSPLGCEAVQLCVIDQGIGIDAKDQYVIFDEFRQVDGSSTRRYEGAGLGLALVRRLVELHGGTVTVHSSLGTGSTFVVTLPVLFTGPGGVVRQARSAPDRLFLELNRTILVVEDDPSAYEAICRHLASTDYVPVRAYDGAQALELIRTAPPLAIILDIILPGIDGWEVLRTLKTSPATSAIPVIIVSMLDNRELGLTLGADDFFLKPVEGQRLCGRLTELLTQTGDDGAKVLVIDDDPAVHEVVKAELEPHGLVVLGALSGRLGISTAEQERPAVIVLDLMMEEMDGFEVAAALKANPTTAQIPVVVLTAKELTFDDRQCLRGKIEALLQKAGTSNLRLVSVVETLLARGQRQLMARASGEPPEVPTTDTATPEGAG